MHSIKNDYCIIFDVNKLPLDFDKWIKLKINKNDLTYMSNLNNCILLNNYYSVVIVSKTNFDIDIAGNIYTIKAGNKYFPYFPKHHNFYVKINSDIDIYLEPNIYKNIIINKIPFNYELNKYNEITKLFYKNVFSYCNVDIMNSKFIGFDLFSSSGMITPKKNDFSKTIDDDKFYLYLEKNNKKDLISLFDKYIQYEFIKIYNISIDI